MLIALVYVMMSLTKTFYWNYNYNANRITKEHSMIKSCFIFGHKNCHEDLVNRIENAINTIHDEYGIDEFIVGTYGNFDAMGQQALINLQNKLQIKSVLLLHYYPQNPDFQLPEGFEALYPTNIEFVPKRYAIVEGNEYVLNRCDAVICYAKWIGNSKNLLGKAVKRGIPIINLAEDE